MSWLQRLNISRALKSRPQPPSPWEGETVDVDRFWAEAWVELSMRQARLAQDFGLGAADWAVDQDAGLIRFARRDGLILNAPVQIIGAWNPRSQAFVWGWDHPSVHTRLRAAAERTRWFGNKHDLPELTARTVKMEEGEAWRLAAVAAKVNAAAGVYRGPTDGPVVFMTIGEPRANAA